MASRDDASRASEQPSLPAAPERSPDGSSDESSGGSVTEAGSSERSAAVEENAPPARGSHYGLPGSSQSDLDKEKISDILDTNEIFTRIVANADHEFGRSARLLFWSGLAAGLAISLSFLGMATVQGALPNAESRLVSSLLYPLGFIFTVLGRYQLFTENTLTPVTLVLTWRASILRLLRIWGLVLVANVLGTALAGFYFARTEILSGEAAIAAIEIGTHLLEMSWWELFTKGTIAGWLVAGMVWLNYAARTATARIFIIFALMYTVAAADLAHCIVGSAEVLYLVFRGEAGLLEYLWHFLAPAALGNTAGGVFLVALLNYAQTEDEVHADRDALSWREWFGGGDVSEPAA